MAEPWDRPASGGNPWDRPNAQPAPQESGPLQQAMHLLGLPPMGPAADYIKGIAQGIITIPERYAKAASKAPMGQITPGMVEPAAAAALLAAGKSPAAAAGADTAALAGLGARTNEARAAGGAAVQEAVRPPGPFDAGGTALEGQVQGQRAVANAVGTPTPPMSAPGGTQPPPMPPDVAGALDTSLGPAGPIPRTPIPEPVGPPRPSEITPKDRAEADALLAREAGAGREILNTDARPIRLRVARQMPDGSIKVGDTGQIHADLIDPLTRTTSPDEMGFVTPDGKFLTREEAYKYVTDANPDVTSKLNPPRPTMRGQDELVAEQYNALFGDSGQKTFQSTPRFKMELEKAGFSPQEQMTITRNYQPTQAPPADVPGAPAQASPLPALPSGSPAPSIVPSVKAAETSAAGMTPEAQAIIDTLSKSIPEGVLNALLRSGIRQAANAVAPGAGPLVTAAMKSAKIYRFLAGVGKAAGDRAKLVPFQQQIATLSRDKSTRDLLQKVVIAANASRPVSSGQRL